MDDVVTLTHRNVCKDGFTVVDTVDAGMHAILLHSLPFSLPSAPGLRSLELTTADPDLPPPPPVFLDLPAPWEAVEHAKKALRVSARISSPLCHPPLPTHLGDILMRAYALERPVNPNMLFQPLHGTGAAHRVGTERGRVYRCAFSFTSHRCHAEAQAANLPLPLHSLLPLSVPLSCLEITMYETLLRPHQVDAAPALVPISVVGEKLKQSEARREEKRLRQIANARAGAERRAAKRKAEDDAPAGPGSDGKRARTDAEHDDGDGDEHVSPEVQAQDEREAEATGGLEAAATEAQAPVGASTTSAPAQEAAEASKICLSKTFPDVRGHTSYLTFAVLLPAAVTQKLGAAATVSEQPSTVASAEPTPPPPGAVEVSDNTNFCVCEERS